MNDAHIEARFKKRRSFVLWSFLFSSALFGVADLFFYYIPGWYEFSWIIGSIIGVILIYNWCRYDALILNKLIPTGLKFGIVLMAIIGVPIYLQRTRGWKGAAKIGFGFPVFLLSLLIYYAAWYSLSWIASAIGYYE